MKKLFSLFAVMLIINSCVKDDDYGTPPYEEYICSDEWTANKTIPEVIAEIGTSGLYPFSEDGDENVIEGYVISSDETGNFYKTISIQNDTINPTRGIQVELNQTNLFNNFPLGSKIRVKLNGINGGIVNSVYKIGGIYNNSVGQLDEVLIPQHVKRACEDLRNITPIAYSSISDATQNDHINTLIKLEGVQFESGEIGNTYAQANPNSTSGYDTANRIIVDEEGNEIILRNSGFADFAAEALPEGSGTITAVLSKYNSDWQLYIRDTSDVVFDQERFDDGGTIGGGGGPIGGDNAQFESCVNEGFSSYDPNDSEFAEYINDAAVGSRYWEVKSFGGNNYIQMSSFNSSDTENVTYFIVPVNFSDADKFSFKTKDGYNNGNVLSVYYSTNYTIGGNIADATLNDITSSFNISTGNTSGYGANFVESGEYNLSSINGNGAIIFKYQGSQSVTTTMQIDDINVVNNEDPDCGGGNPGTGGGIGGNGASFDNCLSEGFNSATDYQTEFTKYENYALEGARYWEARSFDGNKYIQFSAFNSTDAANKAYFIVPVNFSEADGFSFKTKDGYNNGNALKVYYSTNYQIGTDITQATLVDITSSFTLSTGNTGGYAENFTDSGVYDLSSLSGNGFIMFYYEGAGNGVTTTFQIDDITITDNQDPDCGGNPNPGDGDLAFAGSDFEDYAAFLAGLNSFGIKSYATQSTGNGVDGSTALRINMASTAANDYVFTALTRPGLPSTYSTIKFYVKGTSDKSISINLYKNDGTYYKFNLGDVTGNMTVQQAGNNQYTGVINTGGQWAEITLDLSGITDLNTSNTAGDFFALKVGKDVPYDIYLDGFTIQ